MSNRTYKYFKGNALYPFGYGLSYTDFAYEWVNAPKAEYSENENIECTINIKNTGKICGDEVAQIYIKYPQNGTGLPLKELRSFERKHIHEGEAGEVKVSIPIAQLAKWDETSGKTIVPKGTYSLFAGGNSANETIISTFEVK